MPPLASSTIDLHSRRHRATSRRSLSCDDREEPAGSDGSDRRNGIGRGGGEIELKSFREFSNNFASPRLRVIIYLRAMDFFSSYLKDNSRLCLSMELEKRW